MIRTGIGYDVHQLAKGYALVIADVKIPFEKGSVGHSDGDALTHAIIDALLGASALGDIGDYFPSGDGKWKGISSLKLLEEVVAKILSAGYQINNIDSTVIIQQPKLKLHILNIRKALANTIGISFENISVKATTVDNLGEIGTGNGWAAQAIVTLSN